MNILLAIIVTFFAGMGAGLGTGFAGMRYAEDLDFTAYREGLCTGTGFCRQSMQKKNTQYIHMGTFQVSNEKCQQSKEEGGGRACKENADGLFYNDFIHQSVKKCRKAQ